MFDIYTDGSSTGKVGEGGWAYVVTKQGINIYEAHGGADDTTNNRMELSAAIEALRHMYNAYPANTPITIYSDSQYVVKGITEWFPKWEQDMARGKSIKNQDLWIEYKQLVDLFTSLELKWIRGHTGIEFNERCDTLAKQAKLEVKRARDESNERV